MPPLLRPLKRLAARLLPEPLKARLRGRRYGYRRPRVGIPHTVVPREGGTFELRIEGLAPLVVGPEVLETFRFQLRHNGEAIEEMHGFLRHARQGPGTLVDVGANTGAFTLAYCAAHPENRAVAFEPAPEALRALGGAAEASGLAGRITPVPLLLADADGVVGGEINPNQMFSEGGAGSLVVEQTTLDRWVEAAGIAPTALKVDVDGAELEVLRGAAGTLRRFRPVVFLELHHDLLELRGIRPAEVVRVLEDAGYRFETPLGRAVAARALVRTPRALVRLVAVAAEGAAGG